MEDSCSDISNSPGGETSCSSNNSNDNDKHGTISGVGTDTEDEIIKL